MRVGIVGAGVMGGIHAAGWLATPAQVAGFRDIVEGRAQDRAARFGGQVYDSLTALVRDVDVVDVCTPTDVHYEIVMAAIAAGKHVVCEKPLARSVEQGLEMIAASRAAGIKLLVGQVVRFFPEYAAAKAAVDRGVIGKPAVLRLARCVSQPRKATDNWFVDFRRSGGVVLDLMVHDFDYARWVAGEVTTAYAKTLGVARPEAAVDHALAILTHASGAITHVEGSWAFPSGFYTAFELAGSDGLLVFDSERSSPVRFLRHRRPEETVPEVPLPAHPLLESQYTTEIKAFYATLDHDAALRVSATDGLAAVQIALAVIESAQTGRAIRIEPLPIGDLRLGEALA